MNNNSFIRMKPVMFLVLLLVLPIISICSPTDEGIFFTYFSLETWPSY